MHHHSVYPRGQRTLRSAKGLVATLAACAGVAAFAATAHAGSVELDPVETCAISTEGGGCDNGWYVGANCVDNCQGARVLARFDLATEEIPEGSTIDEATLSAAPTSVDAEAHLMLAPWSQLSDWYTSDGTTPWSGAEPLLNGGAEGDYDPTPLGSDVTAIVSDWYDGVTTNDGVIFKETAIGGTWNDFDEIAPTLTVEFTPPS